MKELLESLPRIRLEDAHSFVLLDTCFLINLLEHHKHLEKLNSYSVGITSFNAEEVIHIEHRLSHEDKITLRRFFRSHPKLFIVEVPVHPGDREGERKFVGSVDSELLKNVSDASDAVLMAAAIKTGSTVLTKDKHHLFTVVLESFLQKYGIKVYKDLNSF